MEIQGHGDLAALGVISVDLEVRPGQLQLQRRISSLRNAFDLHNLGERKLGGSGAAASLDGAVQQRDGKDTFKDQLAANDFRLHDRAADLAGQQLSRTAAAGRKIHFFCKGKILFRYLY